MSTKTSTIYLTDSRGSTQHGFSVGVMPHKSGGKLVVELTTEPSSPVLRLALSREDMYALLKVLANHLPNADIS